MNITFSFLTGGIVSALILVIAIFTGFKLLKLISKIILIICVIGVIFFYLQSINFDITKLFML